ncbi:cobalamin adenosyltransferase [Thalassotalea sp. G20_0]|uniref:ATP:cob(I)alamin adenosyltransferase n=1 Tax=Thalassotalea sp. G20_0 TaxID=2821093 RepID=UPI001AD97998|nr:ATP:cob(I)alamin adenosyltransferase [Thalassotalea sp. G20_0]MBO9494418.1 cobalamin adenosyltransferase [Thalassotalea sp. G20_0]
MPLKYSGDIRELCYPFIYEDSPLCDYEIITDELCATLGGVISELEGDQRFFDIYDFLDQLQPRIFHMNGSVRGKQAIFEQQIQWLAGYFDHYQQEIEGQLHGFVLPRGGRPVQLLHSCRSLSKKAVRALVKVDAHGIEVPDELHRFGNMLCNQFFRLTVVINRRLGIVEPEYQSLSYNLKPPSRKEQQ